MYPNKNKQTNQSNINTIVYNLIQLYLQKRLLKKDGRIGVIINDKRKYAVYIWDDSTSQFIAGEPEDEPFFKKELDRFYMEDENINDLVGFMTMFKNDSMVFKTKYVNTKRNTIGVRCGDSSTKADVVKILNDLLQETEPRYNTKSMISHQSLCVVLEIVMRHMTDIALTNPVNDYIKVIPNKIYFIPPEESLLFDIVNFTR